MDNKSSRNAAIVEIELGTAVTNLLTKSQTQLDYFLLRRLRDPHLVEEVIQQTHVEAIRSWHTFRGDSSRVTWLFAIALNVARGQMTRRLKDERLFEPFDDDFCINKYFTESGPLQYVSRKEEATSIMSAFNCLSPEMKDVFSLIIWDGASYEETSIRLGIPVGTVRSRLSRAKAKFQQQFLAQSGAT